MISAVSFEPKKEELFTIADRLTTIIRQGVATIQAERFAGSATGLPPVPEGQPPWGKV